MTLPVITRQVISQHTYNVGFGGTSQAHQVSGHGGNIVYGNWLPAATAEGHEPWSCAGTFSNLTVTRPLGAPTTSAFTCTLYINDVATALTITFTGSDVLQTDATHIVPVAEGDRIWLQVACTQGSGFDLAYSIGFNSAVNQSGYAVGGISGSFGAGSTVVAGALGNGSWSVLPLLPVLYGQYYSIASCAGTITRLDAYAFSGTPAMGSTWIAWMRLNGVIQDGSGGTVDTTTTIDDSGPAAVATFTLPIVPGDHVEFALTRTGADAIFAVTQVGCSCAFSPTTVGQFMLCGGSNNDVSGTVTGYTWPLVDQLTTVEDQASVQMGAGDTFTVLGLYVETGAPGTGKTHTFTLRQNGADTSVTVPISNSATSGLITGQHVPVVEGDVLALASYLSASMSAVPVYWGFLLLSSTVTNPAVSYPIRRLRRFALPFDQNKWIRLSRVELILQAGVGLSTGQGSDPLVMFRLSRDGGMTWDDELTMSMGQIGDYQRRAFLNMLGRARNPVVELTSSDPVFVSWISFTVDYEEGTS